MVNATVQVFSRRRAAGKKAAATWYRAKRSPLSHPPVYPGMHRALDLLSHPSPPHPSRSPGRHGPARCRCWTTSRTEVEARPIRPIRPIEANRRAQLALRLHGLAVPASLVPFEPRGKSDCQLFLPPARRSFRPRLSMILRRHCMW